MENNLEVNKENTPVIVETQQLYLGPIPPASEMAKYEEICPGATNRILQ
jgi:uncharacterized membrane protein